MGTGSEIHATVQGDRKLSTPEDSCDNCGRGNRDSTLLAPAVGNMHGMLKSMRAGKKANDSILDIEIIAEIIRLQAAGVFLDSARRVSRNR